MNVLLVEDDAEQAALVRALLAKQARIDGAPGVSADHADSIAAAIREIAERSYDVVLLDLNLPDSHGLDTLRRMRRATPATPIVVLSGEDDTGVALQALNEGAQDYLLKGQWPRDLLVRSVRYAIERHGAEMRLRERENERDALLTALSEREQEYRTSFEMAPVGKAHADAETWRLTRVNPRLCQITGYSAEELLAMTVVELTHPDDRDRTRQLQLAVEAGTLATMDYEKRYVRKDGTTIWVHVTCAPIRLPDGKALQYVAVIEDVTEHKAAVAALAESERFARSVVDALTSHIAILDERGRIVSLNRAWREFAAGAGGPFGDGFNGAASAVGADYLAICERVARGGFAEAADAAAGVRRVLGGEACEFRLEYGCDLPEAPRWFEMTVTSFAGDGPRRLVVKHSDITSRKRAAALERERSALHDAVRAMDQVLSVVGHELRTPLAGLRILSEFLLTDGAASSEQGTAFLKSIHAEVVRMGDTVNNLLEAARLDSGRARWNWGEYDPESVVRQAVEGVRALADAAGTALDFESHLDGVQALGDGDAVRRLVLNFLSNAIKHTERGGIRVTLRREQDGTAGTAAGREWLRIEVADTGCGIPPHILERLGEAFALNSGVVGAKHIGGTGLGLSICRGIIEAHGGTIQVQSVVGVGTTVSARLRFDLAAPMALRKLTRGVVTDATIQREVAA
jgi:hypothetical protein